MSQAIAGVNYGICNKTVNEANNQTDFLCPDDSVPYNPKLSQLDSKSPDT